jgi:NADH:ubiquinone reductase (H+-translocating)
VDRDPELLKKGRLNFVIVGAGPTGIEMAGALGDIIHDVMPHEYTDLNVKSARIFVVNTTHTVLNAFSEKSQRYATKQLQISDRPDAMQIDWEENEDKRAL